MSKTYIPQSIRRAVFTLEGEKCHLCTAVQSLDLHHTQPEYADGPTTVANLIPLCSNKLGGNACHILAHTAYRSKEKQMGRVLTYEEYAAIVEALRAIMKP